ncbi:MAG: hypothetical protein MSC50_01195 [Campylobacter sp.]|uniref:hypothetical protein n=1 Tax=Campylobacter sp. TaxID=205 RepID=UPI002AA9563C|nr:hypothetical protein [Campylobacter sp.]MCI6578888.1 hypothetical protein [Campylobacter sp.]MCI7014785.1 hypothetical protein [Campylobacter sp.]
MRLLPLFSKPRNDEFCGILEFLTTCVILCHCPSCVFVIPRLDRGISLQII